MKKYRVTITETLLKEVLVEAKDENDAYEKVEHAYSEGDIILDADSLQDNFINVTDHPIYPKIAEYLQVIK